MAGNSSRLTEENRDRQSEFKDCHDILLQAPVGIFTSTVDGRFVAVNPAMAAMYGYESAAHMIREVSDIARQTYADPMDREEFKRLVDLHGEVTNLEGRLRRRDGSVFWASRNARAMRDEQDRITHYQGFTVDITDRKQTEEALRQSETRFRSLLENVSTVAVQGYAMDGTTQYWNRASERLYGYRAEEALGENLLELIIPAEMQGRVRQEMRRMAETGEPMPAAEMTLRHKDGSPVHVFSSHAIVHKADRGAELFCIDIDLTEHKRAEREREKLQNQLLQAQKMESVGLLAGGIAHDFNNLLQIMGGNIQLLLQDMSQNHVQARRVRTVSRCIDRATELVRQLLLFSRKAEARKRVVDFCRELKDVARLLKRTIPRMIAIELNVADDIWSIRADPIQVEQVILNLAGNSADAMAEGGRLLLEAANITAPSGIIHDHPGISPGRYVLLRVIDTGTGMEPEVQEHMFDPFFTTKAVGKGTGLGLASVYGIVRGHGGHIFCDSDPGRGTTFTIYWPAVELDTREPPDTAAPRIEPGGGSETILVVDDEAEIRRLALEVLQTFGYRVLTAASGEEALAVYAESGPEIALVILDLGMPGMGGRQCLRELLRLDPGVRVLIASGYTVDGQINSSKEDGAVEFIAKPYQLSELLVMVRRVLGDDQHNGLP